MTLHRVRPIAVASFRTLSAIGAKLEGDSRGWMPLLFLIAWMKRGAHPGDGVSGDGLAVLYDFSSRMSQPEMPSREP